MMLAQPHGVQLYPKRLGRQRGPVPCSQAGPLRTPAALHCPFEKKNCFLPSTPSVSSEYKEGLSQGRR